MHNTPLYYNKYFAKISLLFLGLAIVSCNTLKRVGENELLIAKDEIYADSIKVKSEDINSLIVQKPNSNIIYPLRLNLYNLAKVNPDSSYQAWLYKKPKREQRLNNFLSVKQAQRLSESFWAVGMSKWLKKIGEPPAIFDTLNTVRTLGRLKAYYNSKGYFNNKSNFTIDTLKKKQRIAVNYNISLGKPYMVHAVTKTIVSPVLDSIYQQHAHESFVKAGQQYDGDDYNAERERLTSLFRNNGIYNFQESSISYTLERDSIAANNHKNMQINLNIKEFKNRGSKAILSTEYDIHKIEKVNIYTDYSFDNRNKAQDSIVYNNYTLYFKDKLRFKPKTITNTIFFKKDSIYSDLDEVRTKRQLANLNVFKYPSISYEQDSLAPTNLTANIYLAPLKKYALVTDFSLSHSNIQTFGVSFSSSLQVKNIFKGAENLNITGRLNIGNSSDPNIADQQLFNLLEFGGDLNLNFPRIWLPLINTDKIIPSYTLPSTKVSIGASSQQNIGLDKNTLNAILGYNWTPSAYKKHSVELLNLQYVKNVKPEQFFNVYTNSYASLNDLAAPFASIEPDLFTQDDDGNLNLTIPNGTDQFIDSIAAGVIASDDTTYEEVVRIGERRDRLTQNNLIFSSNYSVQYTNRANLADNSFYRFRIKGESAGNLLYGLSKIVNLDATAEGESLLLGVPFSQYLKAEVDFVKYWDLSRSNVLALHTFFGLAVPYGNASSIPFVRSYFAGGSNDNRAWSPYSLGPGRTNAINDFNEANLKLALNFEYRFPVAGALNGALFVDAGNIWNVFDNVEDPEATFTGIESLKDIAIGSGIGIRYDFTYFLMRFDLGFKTYNPAEEQAKRWFRDYNLSNSVLQIGINYPF